MYEKYLTALTLMDAVVETKAYTRPATGWGAPYGTLPDISGHPCHFAWDECFDFIYENFARPQTAVVGNVCNWNIKHPEVDLVRPLIDGTYKTRGEEIEQVLRGIPPQLAEEIFPVGVARYLLRDIGLPINIRALRTFKQFHDWYGSMILAG